jgi:hypothetical protein
LAIAGALRAQSSLLRWCFDHVCGFSWVFCNWDWCVFVTTQTHTSAIVGASRSQSSLVSRCFDHVCGFSWVFCKWKWCVLVTTQNTNGQLIAGPSRAQAATSV